MKLNHLKFVKKTFHFIKKKVRNNLVATNQNLINTRAYLKNIDLPYCTEDDLKTLQSLAAGTYQDMMTPHRQKYALDIIQVLRKRCAALNQWFDQVSDHKINKL
jgi:hypothetical protein